jgi:TRAP transporter TAXI family solute receptor
LTEIRPSKPPNDSLSVYGPAVVITLLAFVVAYQFVDPAPPKRISIATASPDGAYYRFGQRYREILARDNVELEVRPTAGSVENLGLLEAATGGVDVALVQGGTGRLVETRDLVSLASLYFEPLWVFHRDGLAVRRLGELRGGRVAVGPVGSGTRAIAMQLLEDNRVTESAATIAPLGGQKAVDALLGGEIDAAFFVASPRSPPVRKLLTAPGISLMSFARADAYTRIHPFLSTVPLPQGAIDLEKNIPPREIVLIAPTASLVAKSDFHPALVDLLLRAATEVHGTGGLFERYAQFPSPEYLEFPLSKDAGRFFKSGSSFFRRYLPFWAASLVERMLVMLVPLVALLIPLIRLTPPVYRWRIRSRIYRWYKELLFIDPTVHAGNDPEHLRSCMAELERIEREVAKVHVPMSYADQLYALRVHMELVREKLLTAMMQTRQASRE